MRALTIERSASLIIFVLLFAMAARVPLDTDTWWHIRSGEHTLYDGMIYTDPFSFTFAGQPWINHSWGAQVVIYAFWQAAGNLGLAVFTATLATGGMYFVYRMCDGNTYLRAFALVLGAATASVFWSARPQMFSFFFSALLLYLIYLYKRDKADRLWFIPLIIGLWGNLHAGFSIAFILLGGVLVGEILANILSPQAAYVIHWSRLSKLLLITIVSSVVLIVNPYGWQIYTVPFQTVNIGALQDYIQEWNSPDFHQVYTWPFIVLLLGGMGATGGSRLRMGWTDFLLTAGTAFMALTAGRNIALFAVVATPVLTTHLDSLLTERGWVLQPVQRSTPLMARVNALLIAVIMLVAVVKVAAVLDAKSVTEAQSQTLPVAATAYLVENQLKGPLFNSYNWGGYLILHAPELPVFVDGRTDLYGDTFLQDYMYAAMGRDGWRDTLDAYAIQTVMVETQSGLALGLRDDASWQIAYSDDLATIFTRQGTHAS